jgi:mRNA deadenylase 3'-5' endonuclease subunit Ccr4
MTRRLRIATLNPLADSYIGYGDYRHAPADLMQPGARIRPLTELITSLNADVVGLQEVERPLVDALDATDEWQTFWTKKGKTNATDGCLTLVRKGLVVDGGEPEVVHYSDGSGHIAQIVKIGGIAIGNTHIKWELQNRTTQTQELLARVATEPHVVLMGDFNDRPGGPARKLVAEAGFRNLSGDDVPTAYIANREGSAALDLFAVRGLQAELVPIQFGPDFDIREIPSYRCPSDHIPILAQVALPQTRH